MSFPPNPIQTRYDDICAKTLRCFPQRDVTVRSIRLNLMSKQISSHDVQKMTGIIKNKLSIRRWSENHETAAQSDIKYNFEPFNGCACRGGG